jgi:hypothetical protein
MKRKKEGFFIVHFPQVRFENGNLVLNTLVRDLLRINSIQKTGRLQNLVAEIASVAVSLLPLRSMFAKLNKGFLKIVNKLLLLGCELLLGLLAPFKNAPKLSLPPREVIAATGENSGGLNPLDRTPGVTPGSPPG